MSDDGCTFCAIIQKVESAFIVYENAHAVVFLDKHPINAGHVLVIPKSHAQSFYELEEHEFIQLMLVVRRVAAVLNATFAPRKVGMLAAGFDVAHAHIHVLPMHDYHDITSKSILEGRRSNPSDKELGTVANQIRKSLGEKSDADLRG